MKCTVDDLMPIFIDIVNQSCQVKVAGKKVFCSTMGLSAYEDALRILEVEGFAKQIKRGKSKGLYELRWDSTFNVTERET